MSHHWPLLSLFLTIFFLQISNLHSTPINSEKTNRFIDTQHTLQYLIKNLITESNTNQQTILLNQLREYLNHMCVVGYFGSSRAHACQQIVDIVHQIDKNDGENNVPFINDNNEQHDIQKRFFCNGFIGCKNAGR